MAGLCTLYDFTVHELDAVLAQAGLQIAVNPFTPEPAERRAFPPPLRLRACRRGHHDRGDRMSANPQSIGTTLRGRTAVDEVRTLLSQLSDVDADMERVDELLEVDAGVKAPAGEYQVAPFIHVTHEELRHLIQRRRDVIVNKLQNKGIRIAPDPEPVHPAEDANRA